MELRTWIQLGEVAESTTSYILCIFGKNRKIKCLALIKIKKVHVNATTYSINFFVEIQLKKR